MDRRLIWTDYDKAGYYVVPNVLSPRDLVSKPDNMDETVTHTRLLRNAVVSNWGKNGKLRDVLPRNKVNTVMILGFPTNRPEVTVQTQIRLLLEEQSDQGLHCWLFHLHLLGEISKGLASLFEF